MTAPRSSPPPRKVGGAQATPTGDSEELLPDERPALRREERQPVRKPSRSFVHDDTGRERTPKDGPWLWANKAALHKIRNNCEEARSALAVYFALCEIASDEQSNEFRVGAHILAAKCCFSRNTVMARLNDLEHVGLVRIFRSETSEHFRMPSAYQLLRCEGREKP